MAESIERLRTALTRSYRLERELGQGGMATVYLAQDLKHDRRVAIKVLRPELAAVIGAERFLREIKTIASLQHPHILGLIDSGEVNGTAYYVMPFVEGESLRDRLAREKQLPVPDAVRIAQEVASALDYAHRHGVIHRDIKPENILLHDAQALVADFGIALAVTSAGGSRMTETGLSLGTPHYMSPEQAMGEREITARSDIYALGAMTYEMLAGEPPFIGPTAQAILARVMTEEPRALTGQRRSIPPGVEVAVFRALEKLPADRYATAAEFAAALAGGGTPSGHIAVVPSFDLRRRGWLLAASMVVLALATGLVIGRRSESPAPEATAVIRAALPLGDSVVIGVIQNAMLAISPDGHLIAFAGVSGAGNSPAIWIRDLASQQSRMLPGTSGGVAPFFAPDGRSIGFISGTGDRIGTRDILVVPVDGGRIRTLVQGQAAGYGADWAADGYIYFTHTSRALARVSAEGGAISLVSSPEVNTSHDYPAVLPGNRFAAVALWRSSLASVRIALIDLTSGGATDVAPGTFARFVEPGFLAIGNGNGEVLAVRVDPQTGKVSGSPTLLLSGVEFESINGTVQFAVSRTGTLVYVPADEANNGLFWVDRAGMFSLADSSLMGQFTDIALSPDGTRLAFSRVVGATNQMSVKQLPNGAVTRLSEVDEYADRGAWSPDGRDVAFLSERDSSRIAWIRRADASNAARALSPASVDLDEVLFDPRGRYLVFRSFGAGAGTRHLLIMQPGVDSVPRGLIDSKFDHYAMTLSPDGNWLAYASEESGRPEVSVRPFPNADSARVSVSLEGGAEPLWSRNGRELYYRGPRGEMYAIPVTMGATFTHGQPQRLFSNPRLQIRQYFRSYDATADGARFLMIASTGRGTGTLTIIFNWHQELERAGATAQ